MDNLQDKYRDPNTMRILKDRIQNLSPGRKLTYMHVCGTHEHAIGRHGIRYLLPDWLRVIAGPGCPVCVCPPSDIDLGVRLALDKKAIVATFGDMMRVPGRISLSEARTMGGDIRVVYGASDAVNLAFQNPDRQVVLLAVGFETTACTIAGALLSDVPSNFSIVISHRLVPPALEALLTIQDLHLDGFLLPGHVLTVTGTDDYDHFVKQSKKPSVVAGFEPVDVMLGLERLVQMTIEGKGGVENVYRRAVRSEGNLKAKEAMVRAFVPVDARWRGLGTIPLSGFALRRELEKFDALKRFDLKPDMTLADSLPGCQCHKVMVGLIEPEECGLFSKTCTPDLPKGPCMVSWEGTCRSRYLFRGAGHE